MNTTLLPLLHPHRFYDVTAYLIHTITTCFASLLSPSLSSRSLGRWLTIYISAPPDGHTEDREGVLFTVRTWNGNDLVRNYTFNGKVTEAEAQERVSAFCEGAAAVFEYAGGGDGTGCDALRLESWINIDRPLDSRLSFPRHMNLGAGISFSAGGGRALSLFGRNPLWWMGSANISLISPILFEVRVRGAGVYVCTVNC